MGFFRSLLFLRMSVSVFPFSSVVREKPSFLPADVVAFPVLDTFFSQLTVIPAPGHVSQPLASVFLGLSVLPRLDPPSFSRNPLFFFSPIQAMSGSHILVILSPSPNSWSYSLSGFQPSTFFQTPLFPPGWVRRFLAPARAIFPSHRSPSSITVIPIPPIRRHSPYSSSPCAASCLRSDAPSRPLRLILVVLKIPDFFPPPPPPSSME